MPTGKMTDVMAPDPMVYYIDGKGRVQLLTLEGAVVEPGDVLANIDSSMMVEAVRYLGTETARVVSVVEDDAEADINKPIVKLRSMGLSHVRHIAAGKQGSRGCVSLSVKKGDTVRRGQQIGTVSDLLTNVELPLRYWGNLGMVKYVFMGSMGFFHEGDSILLVE